MRKTLFICMCLLPLLGIGQEYFMKFKHLTLEDGLSQSSVTCITKDNSGFMWFGTEDGLNRYDGSDFKIYRNIPNDSTSISNSYINAIVAQGNGSLWIGTKNGLNFYDPNTEKFIRFSLNPENSSDFNNSEVTALHLLHNGNLLVGTANGVRIYNPKTGFTKASTAIGKPLNRVASIAQDIDGNIWVLSAEKLQKLTLITETKLEVIHEKSIKTLTNNDLFLDATNVWLGTFKGLLQLNRNTLESQSFQFYQSKDRLDKRNNILSITEGTTGHLWLGTSDGGLIDFEKATGTYRTIVNNPYSPLSLSSNSITNLFLDESKILWLGTYSSGINKYDPYQIQFEHYKHENGAENSLSENTVRAILRSSDGDLWVGTHDGLNRIRSATNTYEIFGYDENNSSTISSNTIRALSEDSRGTIWAGTWENGLNSFDKQTELFYRYIKLPGEKDSLGAVRALAVDVNDHIWIGGDGLWKLDPQNNTTQSYFRKDKTNASDYYTVRSLYFDASNLLWVGTYNHGLHSLDPLTNYSKQYLNNPKDSLSLSHNHVTCAVADNNGFLWIGTYGGGLNRLDTSKGVFRRYNTSNGLLNDVIYGILIDNENFVWFTSNAGLCRFDPNTGEFKYFGVEYGIQSNEFNAGAYHKTKDGEFFFGGINGFNAFYPSTVYGSTKSKKIVFTAFQSMDGEKSLQNQKFLDKAISKAEHIVLNHSQNTFSLKFAELNYSENIEHTYEYYLDGYEKLWRSLGKNRVVALSNLSPGRYRLDVRVKDDLQQKTSIQITVKPPYWRSNLAYLFYCLTAAVITSVVHRKSKKFQKNRKEFELKVANWENGGQSSVLSGSSLPVSEVDVISMEQKFVERAIQIVEENIGDSSFGVLQFMEEMFMSRSQLHRKLIASTGYSTTKFIRYIRVQRAAQLLKGNAGTVTEIAYKVGFENVGYFSKCFSETFGMPPSRYPE